MPIGDPKIKVSHQEFTPQNSNSSKHAPYQDTYFGCEAHYIGLQNDKESQLEVQQKQEFTQWMNVWNNSNTSTT